MKNIKVRIGLILGFFAFVAVIALNPSPALAATKTWTGTSGDHKFNTAGNWSPSGAPSNGDDLVFPNTVTDKSPDNDIVGLSVAGITFSGNGSSGYTVTGNSFTSTAGITFTTTVNSTITTIAAPIVLSGTQTINVNSLSSLYISGAVSGSGNLTKAGTGLLGLTTNNSSYTGTIAVSAGVLMTENANALGGTGAGTTIASGASLVTCYLTDITMAEPLTISGTGNGTYGAVHFASCGGLGATNARLTWSGTVALGANTTLSGYNGNILKITGNLSGSFTIAMQEGYDATLEISAASNTSQTPNGSYPSATKTTTIAAGDNSPSTDITIEKNNIYIINGTRGDITIQAGGVLKGTGTVASINSLGTVASGESPGCLATGDISLGGTFEVEIGGATACTEYDQLIVGGTVTLSGTLSASLFNGFAPSQDQEYMIIDNDGVDAVSGTFSGLAEGATFDLGGYVLRISYVGGDGNDVTLTVVSVPAVPEAGIKLVTGNPIIVTVLGVVAAATTFLVGRKLFAR